MQVQNDATHLDSTPDAVLAYRRAIELAFSDESPASWQAAIEQLNRAANLGHAAAIQDAGLLENWQDQNGWVKLPTFEPLCQAPVILSMPGFMPEGICNRLVKLAEQLVQPALVYDEASGQGRPDPGRTNRAGYFRYDDRNFLTALIQRRISQASGVPLSGFEPLQVLSYEAGQIFDWHVDYLDPHMQAFQNDLTIRGQRIATCLVYLNQGYTGGETGFQINHIRHKGRTGDALMWSNVLPNGNIDPATVHAGLPPTSGRKWVLSQWIRDRPQPVS